MLKIGVIGLGDVSRIHLHAIANQTSACLTAVSDIDKSTQEIVPEVNFYTDYKDMLNQEVLDCVHICLPHYLHYIVTKHCVEKGVHVFLEKPLAIDATEGRKLVEIEKKYPTIKIGISFQNRKNETFEKMNEIINSRKYGKVKGIKGLVSWYRPKTYYDTKPWRGSLKGAGGGVIINQAIHTLDLMQIIGGEIKSINGTLTNLEDYGYEVEDTVIAKIHFEDNVSGLFFATNTNSTNSSVEFQVILEKNKLTI